MEKLYNISEFAEMLNVKVPTLQKWDREGRLKPLRTPTNRRMYTHSQYLECIGNKSSNIDLNNKKVAIYARVSTSEQKNDINRQIEYLYTYAASKSYIVDDVYKDIASGMNYSRTHWNKLITECVNGNISTILVAHKDRFMRFGFDWFSDFMKINYNVAIIVVNNETLSPEKEIIQDLISIITVFSSKIYGLRKYKKKIQEKYAEEDASICHIVLKSEYDYLIHKDK